MHTVEKDSGMPDVSRIILSYKEEAETAKRSRMIQNRENFDCYHLKQDFSHKKAGQSKEFLAKQSMAVEQLTSFLQQGLVDQGDWFGVDSEPGVTQPLILPIEIRRLTERQLEKNDILNLIGDSLKSGALGSLMIVKVHGKMVKKCSYKTEDREGYGPMEKGSKKLIKVEKDVWELQLDLVRQEDYFPDPTGSGLYEIQRVEMDYYELLELAEANPDDYDVEEVRELAKAADVSETQKARQARETGQNIAPQSVGRKRIEIWECWGNLLDPVTGEVLHRNSVSAITTSGELIRPPKANPFWHEKSPFVVSPIIRVPHSVWHKAMMDAPTKHNRAQNELYNLMIDSGMMSVYGIRQIRPSWLMNQNQVADGVAPGSTLLVNTSCPPGQKVMERVDTGSLSTDAVQMFNITDREFQQSAMTNDTRMGTLPQRAVKATEVVASNQTITGVFNGIVKTIENKFIKPMLELSWLTMIQHMNDLDSDEVKAIISEDRAKMLSAFLPEDLFAQCALGHQYKVFGLSMTLNKIQDYRKIMSLLQSLGTPQLQQEFERRYSTSKLLGEMVKALDIQEDKIKMDDQERAQKEQEKQQMMAMAMMQNAGKGGGQGEAPADMQSQIPQQSAQRPEESPGGNLRSMVNQHL